MEEEDADYWIKEINSWIEDLAKADKFWNNDEKVKEEEKENDSIYLKSIAHRILSEDIQLHHFWISFNK
jgi:hypothetical protein